MFPFFIGLDTFIVVISPINWLIKNLLNTKSSHFRFIFQDIIQNAFTNRIEVVLVDFIQHSIYQVLDSVLINSIKVSRN